VKKSFEKERTPFRQDNARRRNGEMKRIKNLAPGDYFSFPNSNKSPVERNERQRTQTVVFPVWKTRLFFFFDDGMIFENVRLNASSRLNECVFHCWVRNFSNRRRTYEW